MPVKIRVDRFKVDALGLRSASYDCTSRVRGPLVGKNIKLK
jgi:hypothetical protein